MGRLYEAIRRNVETLKEIERKLHNNERVGMTEAFYGTIALRKLNYITESMRQNVLGFDSGVIAHRRQDQVFRIPDDLEELLNGWEDQLGPDQVDRIVSDMATQDTIPPFLPELHERNAQNYLDYVFDIADVYARFSENADFGISQEGYTKLLVGVHQEFIHTSLEQGYLYDPRDERLSEAYSFAEDPFYRVRENRLLVAALDLTERDLLNDYLSTAHRAVDQANQDAHIPAPQEYLRRQFPIAKSLSPLHDADPNVNDIATKLKEAIADFRQSRPKEAPAGYPTLGEFLSCSRDLVERAVLDQCVELEDNENGRFLRNFLQNPVETMENHYRGLVEHGSFQDRDKNRSALNNVRHAAQDYQNARQGKTDRWEAFERERRNRFERYVRESIPNYNPAAMKREYAGGFWERKLHTTSKEWNDVVNVMQSWSDIGPDKADFKIPTDAASKYLIHKFPKTAIENITPEMCDQLGPTGRARALFCLSVVDSANAAKAETMNERIEEMNRKGRELRSHIARFDEVFQNQIANDIDNENARDHGVHNDNEIAHDNSVEDNNINIDEAAL